MAKNKHIHKYKRRNGKHNKMFVCDFPDCSFLLHEGQFEILPGRYAICNKCNEKYLFTELSLEEDNPICDECRLVIALKSSIINSTINNDKVNNDIDDTSEIIEEVTISDLDNFLSIKGIE